MSIKIQYPDEGIVIDADYMADRSDTDLAIIAWSRLEDALDMLGDMIGHGAVSTVAEDAYSELALAALAARVLAKRKSGGNLIGIRQGLRNKLLPLIQN